MKVSIQGVKGSFHHLVTVNYFSSFELNECSTFDELVKSIIDEDSPLILLINKAIKNVINLKEDKLVISLKNQSKIDDFRDYQPLLFIGNTTLHTNYPVSNNCSSYRLTLLAHFFDPSPKYGVGGLLRLIRNR